MGGGGAKEYLGMMFTYCLSKLMLRTFVWSHEILIGIYVYV